MHRKSIAPRALALHPGRFRRRLLAWYDRSARDLPWRRTRDPYQVLVSEVMLQQTQVTRVQEYYPQFLERFPNVASLAAAPARAVREAWDGLGYYARARNLHALAKQVTRRHNGMLPDTPEELIELPGVGRYTAGAVASFAYERAVPAVDTNVSRVIRRVFFRRATGNGQPESTVWTLAATLVPKDGKRAWKFNQAIMELGALVCTARKPKCGECPVRSACKTGRRLKPLTVSAASPRTAQPAPDIPRSSP
jgi:A/G-specific adenine glycosylase